MRTSDQDGSLSRFDREALSWDSNPGRVALARAIADTMIRQVPFSPSMDVMDYGAGTGLITLRLQPLIGSIMAVDTSREMLNVLEDKLRKLGASNVTTRLLDLEKTPGLSGKFDAIVSSMTLHHVQDTLTVFRRFFEALKVGGWIAAADLDTEDGTFHPDSTGVYHQGFDRGEVSALLQRVGFADVVMQNAHRFPKPGADGVMREYGIFLATARKRSPSQA
jgi:tRNA (cmo5U34)-methyltransferase